MGENYRSRKRSTEMKIKYEDFFSFFWDPIWILHKGKWKKGRLPWKGTNSRAYAKLNARMAALASDSQ